MLYDRLVLLLDSKIRRFFAQFHRRRIKYIKPLW
nr:MAG TPA: hypothetical protein [Caudoviricetes sp.]